MASPNTDSLAARTHQRSIDVDEYTEAEAANPDCELASEGQETSYPCWRIGLVWNALFCYAGDGPQTGLKACVGC